MPLATDIGQGHRCLYADQRAVSLHRWSAVPLSDHCRTWAPDDVLMPLTPSSRPLL